VVPLPTLEVASRLHNHSLERGIEWITVTTLARDVDDLSVQVGILPFDLDEFDQNITGLSCKNSVKMVPPIPVRPALETRFYAAKGPQLEDGSYPRRWPPENMVTLCLQLDVNRLTQLHARAMNYKGATFRALILTLIIALIIALTLNSIIKDLFQLSFS